MIYEKGEYAFFEGSRSEYKTAVKASDTIAGFKITGVLPGKVTLDVNGKEIDLAVGQELKRQDEGEWSVSGRSDSDSRSENGSRSRDSSSSASASGSSGDEDDILQKLLKKREEELTK
jgi:hypothetical protein